MTTRLDLLEKLSAKLREFKDNGLKFNMNFWKREEHRPEDNFCQTSCCAMGLGMLTIPEFSTVFEFVPQSKDGYDTIWEIVLKNENFYPEDFRSTEFLMDHLSRGFGIKVTEAENLFIPNSYANSSHYILPTDVADRIDALIGHYRNPDKVFPTFAVHI